MAWDNDRKDYAYKAFTEGEFDFSTAWAATPFNTEYNYINLSYYHAMKIFYNDQQSDIIDRRCLLYYYLENDFNTDNYINADNSTAGYKPMLNNDQNVLPVSSEIKRIIQNRNILYDETPERVFSNRDNINDKMNMLYSNADINTFMATADEMADLLGIVAVAPYWRDGELLALYITPDMFRVKTDINDPLKITEFWLQDFDTNNSEYILRVWTDETYKIISGMDGSVISEQPNEYGVIPFVFLRSESNTFYSPGQYQLVEDQLTINKLKYLQAKDSTYHGLSLKIARNINPAAFTNASYDQILFIQDKTNIGETTEADFAFLKPEPAYMEIQEFIDRIKFNMYRKMGIPASMITEDNAGQSGISRVIERSELIEVRKKNIGSRAKFERGFADMVVITGNIDSNLGININDIEFNINYAEITILQEPEQEYNFDKILLDSGIINPNTFVKKWSGLDNLQTDNKTIEYVNNNLELKDKIFSENETVIVEQQDTAINDVQEDINNEPI